MLKTLIISVWILMHPVHVTLTSIEFVPEPVTFSVFVRMYFDDFMADSKLAGNVLNSADFSTGTAASREEMEKYIGKKLVIKADERLLAGRLTDIKVEENEISINLTYNGDRAPGRIAVKNLIMTDLYPDMSNMVIVKVNDFEEGARLTTEITERTFVIK